MEIVIGVILLVGAFALGHNQEAVQAQTRLESEQAEATAENGFLSCPVDDARPLTRIGDSVPVPEKKINLSEEIGSEYYLKNGTMSLLQVGKIETYGQGCDGPLEKVVRDFMIEGDYVSVIDEKAGVEQFGRRIPDRMDIILGVLDCARESVSIAKRIQGFAKDIGVKNVWFVLNKTESKDMAASVMDLLGGLREKVVGSIPYDPDLVRAALSGRPISEHGVGKNVELIVQRLEKAASADESGRN